MTLRGLMMFTSDHRMRGLDVAGPRGLFTIHSVKSTLVSAFIGRGVFRLMIDEDYGRLLSVFSSIMNEAAAVTGTRYYTFLGEYSLGKSLVYEPYVDLMKRITVRISPRMARVTYGEKSRGFRKTGEYAVHEVWSTLRRIVEMVHSGA
jgi:hypothetical protein